MKRSIVIAGLLAYGALLLSKFVVYELTMDACYDGGGGYLEELAKCSHSQVEVDRYRLKNGG